ncbi:hypothetical protein ACFQ0M_07980 [Kitasatospora aburaviensis]
MGGPLPTDTLLTIAVEHTTPARRADVDEAVRNELLQQAGGRFYSDLARYRLIHARLALIADDLVKAEELWLAACRFLVAYGWRKDITVYEVLDPLPALVATDPARGGRGWRASSHCANALSFTRTARRPTPPARDGGASWPGQTPRPLPISQPPTCSVTATARTPSSTAPEKTSGARGATPQIAATALRITLDTPLLQADAELLDRLARTIGPSTPDGVPRLLRLALSRADERQANRGSSTDETMPTDAQLVAELNAVAERIGAPQLTPCPNHWSPTSPRPFAAHQAPRSWPLRRRRHLPPCHPRAPSRSA